jgi:hypothetical protein
MHVYARVFIPVCVPQPRTRSFPSSAAAVAAAESGEAGAALCPFAGENPEGGGRLYLVSQSAVQEGLK